MVLVKIYTPVHYHVKNYRICKNKICQIPGTFFDGNMVVSAGMAHIALVGDRTHDLPHTVASNMVKVYHALTHSATAAVG